MGAIAVLKVANSCGERVRVAVGNGRGVLLGVSVIVGVKVSVAVG